MHVQKDIPVKTIMRAHTVQKAGLMITFPAFFFFVFYSLFQQNKSPSRRQICVTHAPLTQLIPLFPMGCLGGDEVYFWTLHQISIIENISEATGQHLAHTLLTKPVGCVEAVSECISLGVHRKGQWVNW